MSCFDLSRVSAYKVRAFVLTFLAYAIYTATRVALPIAKSSLHPDKVTPSSPGYAPFDSHAEGATYLGVLDTVFLLAYSIGLFVSGTLGDRIDLRTFMSAGMMIAGLSCMAFGAAVYFNIHSLAFFIACQLMAGLAQSSGWPACVSCESTAAQCLPCSDSHDSIAETD